MVMLDYEKKLQALRSKIELADGSPLSIEVEVSGLNEGESHADLARDLLLSLSDDAHSGAMYTLVHAAESLDKSPYRFYVAVVLSILPQLSATAPNWALHVVRRIMNADASLVELETQLQVAPAPIKEAARDICELNDAIELDYIAQTDKARIARVAS